jgi:hypothetical protein
MVESSSDFRKLRTGYAFRSRNILIFKIKIGNQ